MNLPAMGLTLLGGGLIWVGVELFSRWRARRFQSQILARLAAPDRTPSRLEPECRFVVHFDPSEIRCERPDGVVERVTWDDLLRVELLTTDDGPFAPDVFWVLSGTDAGCLVPQGATGDQALLERLGRLPGFDHEAVIRAMGSTENARFLCWQRTF